MSGHRLRVRLRRIWRHQGRHAAVAGGLSAAAGLAIIAAAWICCPFPRERLDRWSISPVVDDRDGRALLEMVGRDGQWRRPVPLEQMSPWIVRATVAVEDERFDSHPGIDPIAGLRALGQDALALRTVSGASTLTMQLCRMMEDRPRTLSAKLIESFRALQLERLLDKAAILELYLNTAPYGGNLRGVEAAARAWFHKRAADLTLGEAALLAGLPQSPTRYRPDRFPERARARRAHVLARMAALNMISPPQAEVALAEPLPVRKEMPCAGRLSHAARLAIQRRPSGGRTTIDSAVQAKIESVLAAPGPLLPAGSQAAAVVIEIRTGDILALVGSRDPDRPRDGQVNGATAPRSPGSTLKPFIYAAAIEAGLIDARTILHDIPIERAGWTPANFDRQFAGPVLAAEALRRSLNVPAILVAEGTGLDHCLGTIEAVGVRLPAVAHERAGLAVVTGAVEVTLLDLVNGYATLGRGGTRMAPRLFLDEAIRPAAVLSPDACAVVNEILSSRNRRPRGTEGRDEHSIPWFMWKTGTSAGRRDAWAVGHNHRFAIGVWIGRFDGGGDPGFVGAEAAEPLLASLFDLACLRNPIDPPPATSRPASRPLPPPPELADALRILSPAPGATFIAVSGSTTLHVRANRTAALAWFLDGRVVAASDLERLVLPPGRHELRCVGADGTAAASRFTVRSMPGSPGHNVPLASLRNEGLH